MSIKSGILLVENITTILDSSVKPNKSYESEDAFLVKSTTEIPYTEGITFGVILDNIPEGMPVNATWNYPTRDSKIRDNYTFEQWPAMPSRNFYWKLDKGEPPGEYLIKIFSGDKIIKTVSFTVNK